MSKFIRFIFFSRFLLKSTLYFANNGLISKKVSRLKSVPVQVKKIRAADQPDVCVYPRSSARFFILLSL